VLLETIKSPGIAHLSYLVGDGRRAAVIDPHCIPDMWRASFGGDLAPRLTIAFLVGAIGIYALRSAGLVELEVRPAGVGRNVIGGLIFGVGMALLGWCPGTAVGALGEGRLDALVGLAGMVVGGMLFAQVYPDAKRIYRLGHIGERTWWQMLGINPWLFIVPVCVALGALMWWFERVGL